MTDEKFTELTQFAPKSRKKPKEGDVFITKPEGRDYFFGKVVEVGIRNRDVFMNNMILVYVYNIESEEKIILDNLDNYPLLINPLIINYRGWLDGYFETIGNVPVTEKERKIDFGFYDDIHTDGIRYYDKHGEKVSVRPRYCSFAGLASYGAIGRYIKNALNK